uniref:Uncharacterized protein n=1 Tax=Cacopsylla melanoneura TaxID=428564 RepID=A0A8D8M908_9HEMI
MMKLKTNIHAMEAHLRHTDKTDRSPYETTSQLSSLSSGNAVSPNNNTSGTGPAGAAQFGNNVHDYYASLRHNVMSLLENGSTAPTVSHNSYLTKLQSLCGAGGSNTSSADYYNLNLKSAHKMATM